MRECGQTAYFTFWKLSLWLSHPVNTLDCIILNNDTDFKWSKICNVHETGTIEMEKHSSSRKSFRKTVRLIHSSYLFEFNKN